MSKERDVAHAHDMKRTALDLSGFSLKTPKTQSSHEKKHQINPS